MGRCDFTHGDAAGFMAITQARCPKAEANQKNQNAPKRDTTDAFGWMLDPVLPARRQRRSPPTKRAAPRHTHDEQPAEEESLALTPSLINARRTNKRQRRSSPIKRAAPKHTHDEQPAEEESDEESLALTPSLINARRTYTALVEANKGGDIVGRIRKMSLHMAAVGNGDVYPHCPKQSVLVKQLVSTGMGCAEVGALVAQLPVFAFSELVHYFRECGAYIQCRVLAGVLVNGRHVYDLEELEDRTPHRGVELRRICAMEAP